MGIFSSSSFETRLSKEAMIEKLKYSFPDFRWHGGDSDAQGPYISGTAQNSIRVQIWLGETPYDATVSIRPESVDAAQRDVFMSRFEEVLQTFSDA